jgi:hypothetical protein
LKIRHEGPWRSPDSLGTGGFFKELKCLSSGLSSKSITSYFASLTTGILEYWSDGIMSFGKMGQCFIGKIPSDVEVKRSSEKSYFLININIPIFHHSIIPCAVQKTKRQKPQLLSISCRISEAYN